VADDKTAYIMTLNLVDEDYSTSRDFAVADTNSEDVSAIETTFTADWNNQSIKPSDGVDLVWSPGALDSELSLINSVRHTLDIYNEEIDDSAVTSALEAAARRRVDVKVVMTASSDWDSAFKKLTGAGVHVRTYKPNASLYIHAKMILVDGRRVFLGSQNFSAGSLDDNRELGIILSTGAIIRSLEGTFAGDYAHATPFPTSRLPSRPAACRPTGMAAIRTGTCTSRARLMWTRRRPPTGTATRTTRTRPGTRTSTCTRPKAPQATW
jgi:phosphatidylserine/phosphatidylglycerophosphate/cardiolipin synthase-like enzyme